MKHVAQIVAWLCVTAMVGGCMSMVYLADKNKREKKGLIATECVKSGGEWLSSWGNYECKRTR